MCSVWIDIYGHKAIFGWPMGKVEKHARSASDAQPFNALHLFEAGWTESKGTPIKEYNSAYFVNFP